MRTCTICRHPQLAEIHDAIIRGVPFRNIGKQFGVGWQSVRKHKLNCMPRLLEQAQTEKQLEESENIGDLVGKWYREISELYEQAKEQQDIRLALAAVDRALKCIELVQKRTIEGAVANTLIINYMDLRKPWEKEAKRAVNER